jgi:hypothetical protein
VENIRLANKQIAILYAVGDRKKLILFFAVTLRGDKALYIAEGAFKDF